MRLLAAGLSVVMLAMIGRALHTLYEEGDAMCEALYGNLERLPGPRTPCTSTHYVDSFSQLVEVRSTYDYRDGELAHVSIDRGGDGDLDIAYDCSTLGKMLMPATNFAAWSSFGVSTELRKTSVLMDITREQTRVHAPHQLETRARLETHPSSRLIGRFSAKTTTHDGQVIHRVDYSPHQAMLTYEEFDYDVSGDLRRAERTSVDGNQISGRAIEYTYECWP